MVCCFSVCNDGGLIEIVNVLDIKVVGFFNIDIGGIS